MAQDTYSGVVSGWINSPLHNANMRWDADYMAVAFIHSETNSWGRGYVSVIVTFGTIQTDHYSIDGIDMGAYDTDKAPLYGYTIHRSYGDIYISKEYMANEELEVPYEKWDEYLNSYKTVR